MRSCSALLWVECVWGQEQRGLGEGSFAGQWVMMKGAQGLVQPQTITPSVVCRRRGVSRPWEAVVPSTGVAPSKEGRAETGEQLAGAC